MNFQNDPYFIIIPTIQISSEVRFFQEGTPYENAIAERVNGILKEEFLLDQTFASFKDALQAVDSAVERYNTIRPHSSCDNMTPVMAHQENRLLKKHWRQKMYKGIHFKE